MTQDDLMIIIGAGVVLTPLITEAVKKVLKKYVPNVLALIVSVVVGLALSVGYCIMNSISIDPKTIVMIFAIIIINWLGAMLGYDKVKQAIGQFKEV